MLVDWYLWLKAFHIMAVIAWMAGLFYLPRLFVYHVERGTGEEPVATLRIMEAKLLRVIMTPAMIASWAFGLALALVPGVVDFAAPWVWLKLAGILAMSAFHMWLARQRRRLETGEGQVLTGRQYRLMNEVPTVLMVVIVLSVVLKF